MSTFTKISFCLLGALLLLSGCSTTNQSSDVPDAQGLNSLSKHQRADQMHKGNSQTTVEGMLSKVRRRHLSSNTSSSKDYYLILKFNPQQVALTEQQTTQIKNLVERIGHPQNYLLQVFAGPNDTRNKFKSLYISEQRLKTINQLVGKSFGKIETYFDPNLPLSSISLQFLLPLKS